jgi:diguanylate cyclase (GGDEF)-like protein
MKRSSAETRTAKGANTGKKAPAPERIPQEQPERAPEGWSEIQKTIAESCGISLLTVEGYQPPALAIANNNSICEALQSSPEHVKLCDPFCGVAHSRAISENSITHYRCHAGLQCFAMPAEIHEQSQLVTIGGRAFVSSSDYRELAERFRSGDLQDLFSEDLFRNVIFADEADLDHAALRVSKAARDFRNQTTVRVDPAPIAQADDAENQGVVKTVETEIESAAADTDGPGDSLHPHSQEPAQSSDAFMDSIRRFSERIDASDPAQTYQSIVAQSADLLNAERGSLLLLDESTNALTLTAARGMRAAVNDVEPIPVGEGIAGSVAREGIPLVGTTDDLGQPGSSDRGYKTRSFISYPISIGNRKFGVLNLTDKIGGGAYDAADLSVIEQVAPQIALALERASWQQRANQFQLMSITDPLTGLHNRRYLEARLTEELSRSKRYDYPLSFMMIDIDDFKLYNDRNGHQAGDRALEITAQCLRAALRKVDVASRYGGEEFSILLPQTTLQEAGVLADRIRRKILSAQFPHGKSQPLGALSVSIGLSTFSASLDSAEAIVRAADRALYHAKSHGKNRAYAYHGAQTRTAGTTANSEQ